MGQAKARGERSAVINKQPPSPWPGRLTFGYLFIMFTVFPLYFDKNGFSGITDAKYAFFTAATIWYLVLMACLFLILVLSGKLRLSPRQLWRAVSWPQKLVFLFLAVCCLSYFFSSFRPYNWVGLNRFDGLKTLLLYGAIYLAVSFTGKFRPALIYGFAGSMSAISVISFLQRCGKNPFHLFPPDTFAQRFAFMGTIGNTNMMGGILTLSLPLFFAAFLLLKHRWRYVLLPASALCWVCFLLADVDSARFGFLFTLLVMIPLLLNTPARIRDASLMLAVLCASSAGFAGFSAELVFDGKTYIGLAPSYSGVSIPMLACALALLLVWLSLTLWGGRLRISPRAYSIFFICLLGAGILAGAVWLLNYNGPESGIVYEASQILHGNINDHMGSDRILVWRRAITLFPEHPLLGGGPDSFGMRFASEFKEEVKAAGIGSFFDFAHNDYLQILLNLGLLGLIAYLASVATQAVRCVKKRARLAVPLLSVPVLCYLSHIFFSFSIIIVAPIFWALWGLLEAECRTPGTPGEP